jgi:hypothetical protein
MLKACWIAKVADHSKVEDVWNAREKAFPKTKRMVSEVDAALRSAGVLAVFDRMWNAMHGYVHSGPHQLSRRRFGGSRGAGGYSAQERIQVLDFATAALLLVTQQYLLYVGATVDSLLIHAIYGDYLRRDIQSALVRGMS